MVVQVLGVGNQVVVHGRPAAGVWMRSAATLLHAAIRPAAPDIGVEELGGVINVAPADLVVGEADHVFEPLPGDEDRHGFAQRDLRMGEGGEVVVAGEVADQTDVLVNQAVAVQRALLGEAHTGGIDHGQVAAHMGDVLGSHSVFSIRWLRSSSWRDWIASPNSLK
ncbi:hypothetical protein D9M68_761810 [compost metagenome]